MPPIGALPWIEALDRSLAGLDAAGTTVTVRHHLEDGPSWLVVADGTRVHAHAAGDHDEAADVTFTWQADDAAAVAAGTTTVLAVFGTGRLRVGGDLRRLAEATALFARFPGVAA
jgi:alkyl sulfatase BDS1-like metallo-beta-lactamase superfamily hydrolase